MSICRRGSNLNSPIIKLNGVHFPKAALTKYGASSVIIKGLVHPKMKILSVFTHPHVECFNYVNGE